MSLQSIVYNWGEPAKLMDTFWSNRSQLFYVNDGTVGPTSSVTDDEEPNSQGRGGYNSSTSVFNFSPITGYSGRHSTIVIYSCGQDAVVTSAAVDTGTLTEIPLYSIATNVDYHVSPRVFHSNVPVSEAVEVTAAWTADGGPRVGFMVAFRIPGKWNPNYFTPATTLREGVDGERLPSSAVSASEGYGNTVRGVFLDTTIPANGFEIMMGNTSGPNTGTTPSWAYTYSSSTFTKLTKEKSYSQYWYSHASASIAVNASPVPLAIVRQAFAREYTGGVFSAEFEQSYPLERADTGTVGVLGFRFTSD
jgi:hypothetical protein